VNQNGRAAAAMLGLAGFVVLAVSEFGGEVEQAVETTERVVGCPGCGVLSRSHDRHRAHRADPTACVAHRAGPPRGLQAGRAGRHTVAQVAGQLGVGWATVMAAVREYGYLLVDDPIRLTGVRTLGVDETAFQGAGPRRSTTFVTGIVDLSGATARLLDVVPGRSGTALSQWVNGRSPQWRDGISVAALDPFRGYATALTATLPAATRVLDCFHVTRLGFAAVDDVRRRVQQETLRHRGRRDDPLYGIRRLLRRRADRLSPHAWARLLTGLDLGDRGAQIGRTWIAAQDLRLIYSARGRADAEQRLHRWLTFCADTDIPELHRLARTIDSGDTNCWPTSTPVVGVSNGPTEVTKLLIKR